MSLIDLIIIFIIFLFILASFNAGFFFEIFTLLNFGISIFLAYTLSPILFKYFNFITSNQYILKIIAGTLIFIIVYLALKLIFDSIFDLIDKTNLTALDRFLGIILGFFKGLIFITILLFILQKANSEYFNNILKDSIISNIIVEKFGSELKKI